MGPGIVIPAPVVREVPGHGWVWDESEVDAEYGGNKVRKLAGLLPAALAAGADTLVTVGATGSHHVLATALFGARLGLATHAVLFDQPERPDVLHQLGRIERACASVRRVATPAQAVARAELQVLAWRAQGRRVVGVPVGGTSVVGMAGWREAARDVARRVRSGALPAPDRVVVAAGTGGTAAALLAGFALEGLETQVVAVRVSPRWAIGARRLRALAHRALEGAEATLPPLRLVQGWPTGYGVVDDSVLAALAHGRAAGVCLEATYTAKAFDEWWRGSPRSWFVATAPLPPPR